MRRCMKKRCPTYSTAATKPTPPRPQNSTCQMIMCAPGLECLDVPAFALARAVAGSGDAPGGVAWPSHSFQGLHDEESRRVNRLGVRLGDVRTRLHDGPPDDEPVFLP